eukprot:scaffold50291_cov53-Cyclotella_meneghiniana.AAC.1
MEQPSVVEMEMSFTGLNEIEDEYVFIQEDDMDFDDESYDHCDLSPDLSCAASVCSGVTLNDFKDIGSSMVSLEDDRNGNEKKGVKNDDSNDTMDVSLPGRRLCNKKRRKKLKMLKKAAAAARFEESRKAQLHSEAVNNSVQGSRTKSRSTSKNHMACAQESLEVGGRQKKNSTVNYVL